MQRGNSLVVIAVVLDCRFGRHSHKVRVLAHNRHYGWRSHQVCVRHSGLADDPQWLRNHQVHVHWMRKQRLVGLLFWWCDYVAFGGERYCLFEHWW